jgi:GAF domain-containing protein
MNRGDKSDHGAARRSSAARGAVVSRSARLAPSAGTAGKRRIARLERELKEALEQQAATAEILNVIASSGGELQPVFDAILKKAVRLCDAKFGNLWLCEGDTYRIAAIHGGPPAYRRFLERNPVVRPEAKSVLARIGRERGAIQIADVSNAPTYGSQMRMATIKLAKARTLLAVPMLKGDEIIGAIGIYRQDVRAFDQRQIEIVSGFAAQAVIAIENARLLNELRQRTDDLAESLAQQTATADVLKVISSSPGELTPVFDAILENATRICEAKFGNLLLYEEGGFRRVALYGATAAWADSRAHAPVIRPSPINPISRMIDNNQVVHVPDMAAEPAYIERDPAVVAVVEDSGARTIVGVPMLKDDKLIGAIAIYRQEVRLFTDKQIALVQNFAAQAVIAIENARLLSELRQRTDDLTESLEQQTATSQVLEAISSSPGDLKPVFEAILTNATRICAASFGNLLLFDGESFRVTTMHGAVPAWSELRRRDPTVHGGANHPLSRIARTKQIEHIPDIRKEPAYIEGDPAITPMVDVAGARTLLIVPMLKDDTLVGVIGIYRQEVRPFNAKQVALVQNFAAQAVIAIENARLLSELRQRTDDLTESLQQQTATADVLKVISSSPGDLDPVFRSILANATQICEAQFAVMSMFQDGQLRAAAFHNVPAAFQQLRRREKTVPLDKTVAGRVLETKEVVQFSDIAAAGAYAEAPLVKMTGARSIVGVPMLKESNLVGVFTIYRTEVRAFTDKQVELLKNFAAQAVIAIENARLLNELRQRTDDLSEALDQQMATSEVLKVISTSPGELNPVFQSILANAARICNAHFGVLFLVEGGLIRPASTLNVPAKLKAFFKGRGAFLPPEGSPMRQTLETKELVHIADDAASPRPSPAATLGNARTNLTVPMLKDGELVGAIAIFRQEIHPFTDKQIALVQNFAAQAVIAIENARLLNELRQRTDDLTESLEQQTATSEVLKVISSSPGELTPVFDAILSNATRLSEAKFGILLLREQDGFRTVALHNAPPGFAEYRQGEPMLYPAPETALGRLITNGQVYQIPDMRLHKGYLSRAPGPVSLVELAGARTVLNVPMHKEGELVGCIAFYRQEVRPFTDQQVALVQSFAAQAVIAIENARLLNELHKRTDDLTESLKQQTATADVLKVISRSTFDLHVVLNTLIESAARLCRADRVAMRLLREGAYHTVALHGYSAEHDAYMKSHPTKAEQSSLAGRVVSAGKPVQIEDITTEPDLTLVKSAPGFGMVRTLLGVPLLREGSPVGVFILSRERVEPFTDKQIELVATFADQAVIAIENVRLFDEVQARTIELQESLEYQTATSEVLKAISQSAFDLQPVLETLVESAGRLCQAENVQIFLRHDALYRLVAHNGFSPDYQAYVREHPIAPGRGTLVARTALEVAPVHIPDVLADPEYTWHKGRRLAGFRAMLGVPLLRDGSCVGVMAMTRATPQPFTARQIELVSTFADQAVIAIENVRLFDEIQDKSRQLEEASKHKSQFLANMSHELRTPLNAILGYTELILDNIYGDTPDRMRDVLDRIQRNGKHLLGLINDVLDLSKIEAGQLTLALTDYSIRDVVQSVFSAVEPLAVNKNLAFKVEVPPDLPVGRGDERRLTQVLLNLVGNAIKFTDKGEVAILAESNNGSFTIAVRDTGPGIARADQGKIFEEFRQADDSLTRKKGGTGLGLSISKRIIEMHGGRLWVDSEPGQGSTFSFTVPVTVERQVGQS